MENDPKTLLLQLVSNLELAEMRAQKLSNPETGFSLDRRIRYVPRIINCLLEEVKDILSEAFPSDGVVYEPIRLHEPSEGLDWKQEQEHLIQEQVITRGLGVPRHYYDPPTHSE